MRLRYIVPALAGLAALACGFADLFTSNPVGDVVITYSGPTSLRVDDRLPFALSVTIAGTPVPNPRLYITSSDPSLLSITPNGDTLVGLSRGFDTLTIRLVASIFTDSFPTLVQPVRVNP